MPFRTVWEKEGIKWEFYGHVTPEDIKNANMHFFQDARAKTSKYQILNTIEVSSVVWKPLEIVETSLDDVAASRSNNKLKLVYIAPNPIVREKIEKYVEISRKLNSEWEFRGFDSEEEAREWLEEEDQYFV